MSIFRWRYFTWAVAALVVSCANCFAVVDSDGDGFTDQEETFLGFNTGNASSYPGAITNGFSSATNLIYVAKTGSDGNPGTAGQPYLTIQKAATTAKTKSQAGIGSTINIMPGSYGETILYKASSGDLVAPVIFTAATNGTVAITGADVWTNGWSLVSGNRYQHSWTNAWGLAPNPGGWPTLSNLVRRCEIVIVNGNLYTQVESLGAMTGSTYFVDEANSLLYVEHRAGVKSNAFYEVAQRTNLLTVTQSSTYKVANVVLQGLEFRVAATPVAYPAVEFYNASNILVNACVFNWNNWIGMNFDYGRCITIRDCQADHNGGMGIQAGNNEKNIVVDGVETSFNNWRGMLGGFNGFSIAGIKALKIHTALFRNHVAVENQTYGLWLDYDCKNIFVEGCVYDGNSKEGLQFEANQGPVLVQDVVSSRALGAALLLQNVEHLTVTNSVFISSGSTIGWGDMGSSVSSSRSVADWEAGTNSTLTAAWWTLKDNISRCGGGYQYGIYMVSVANFPNFTNSMSSDYNNWENFYQPNLFTLNGGTTKWNLPQWQAATGKDANSDTNNLLMTNAAIQDTHIDLTSPNDSHGSDTDAVCDTLTNGTSAANVILLKFDLSSMTNVPREAELRMSALSSRNGSQFYVYRMTTDWDENATGAKAKPNTSTSWAGGAFSALDYDANPVRAGLIGTTNTGTLNTFVDVTPLAKSWDSGTSPNYGVAIIAQPIWDTPVNDVSNSNWRQVTFVTRESLLTNQWPRIASLNRGEGGGCPSITLSPSVLPTGTVNVAYSQPITASGGAGPYTYAKTSGSLPTGLGLSSAGTLSGTPTMPGSSSFTVQATDTNACTGAKDYSLVINGGCPAITLAPSTLPTGTVGWVYSQAITASGGASPYTYTNSAGTLPAGLSLSSAGTLSGTPTTAGTNTFTVRATDANTCKGSNSYTVVISATGVCPAITLLPSTLPNGNVGSAYSQTITASGGISPYTYTKSAGTLPTGLNLSSGGTLSGTSMAPGSFAFTVQASDANACKGSNSYTVVMSSGRRGEHVSTDDHAIRRARCQARCLPGPSGRRTVRRSRPAAAPVRTRTRTVPARCRVV